MENQSTETNPDLKQMLKLGDKDIKTAVITVFFTFKKLCKDMKDIKKIQVILLEMKAVISEIKNTLDGGKQVAWW